MNENGYVDISAEDVVNAMELDGYKKFTGNFFDFDNDGKIIAACAMGQAALNLNITTYDVITILAQIYFKETPSSSREVSANEWVAGINDNTRTQVPTIAKKLRVLIKNHPKYKRKVNSRVAHYKARKAQ